MAFETTLKLYLYLYGKYSTQTMIFWSICAFIWFRNMKKMLLQMTSASLQPQPVPSLLSRAKYSGSQCHFKIWLDCRKLKNVPCLIMPMSPKCQKKSLIDVNYVMSYNMMIGYVMIFFVPHCQNLRIFSYVNGF
jgi:hypothetical protein